MKSGGNDSVADVFDAFWNASESPSERREATQRREASSFEGGTLSQHAPSGTGAATADLVRALEFLNEQRDRETSFSVFAERLPGDAVASLNTALDLVGSGWIELKGGADARIVKLTARGAAVLASSLAPS